MSTGKVTVMRCDRPKCQTFVRLPLDAADPGNSQKLRELAAAAGWTQFTQQGLLDYTADYCPRHKGSGSAGIRSWGMEPSPIREVIVGGLVVHESRRAIRSGSTGPATPDLPTTEPKAKD